MKILYTSKPIVGRGGFLKKIEPLGGGAAAISSFELNELSLNSIPPHEAHTREYPHPTPRGGHSPKLTHDIRIINLFVGI